MKKKITLVLIALIILVSILGTICFAKEIQPRTSEEDGITPISQPLPEEDGTDPISETNPEDDNNSETDETPQYDITYSDLYVFEDKDYEMNKLIDGNAYIMTNGNVKFTGEVNGSVFIFANGTVEFGEEAYVADSLYVFAKEVKVNGAIYDIYGATERFELMEKAYISRDIKIAAANVKLRGTVYRDVFLTADNIDVKDENSSLFAGGDFNYTSGKEVEGLQDVVTYGEIHFKLAKETSVEITLAEKIKDYAFSAVTSIIYALVIYFVLKLLSPRFTEAITKDLKEKSIIAFVVGLITWAIIFIAIIMSIMLLFTAIGSPISIIAWLIMTIIIYISSAVFSISITGIFKDKIEAVKTNKVLEVCLLMLIALCVWILQKLPYIGGLCNFIILTTGIGLIIRNIIAKKEIEKTTEQPVVEE
ncbi:MAG: hypothetical protein HFJ18_01170 [Clostridia bacterium]|nr:hypothetical protein [Clostridia bacterium]